MPCAFHTRKSRPSGLRAPLNPNEESECFYFMCSQAGTRYGYGMAAIASPLANRRSCDPPTGADRLDQHAATDVGSPSSVVSRFHP